MNKKGQDFLNVAEIIIFLVCAILSLFFLDVLHNDNVNNVDARIYEVQNDYKTLQQLRTIAQLPVEYQGKTLTFAQLANKYFETYDYLQERGNYISTTQRNTLESSLSIMEVILKDTARNNFAPFINNPRVDDTTNIELRYILNDNLIRNLHLGGYITTSKDASYVPVETTLQLPAYFKHRNYVPGTYYIELHLYNNHQK